MTPDLKAMVEAMVAAMPGAIISKGEVLTVGAGWVNLEKVAQAAFSAGAEYAFRDGFNAGEDYTTDGEKDRRADTAWEFYRASLTPASD